MIIIFKIKINFYSKIQFSVDKSGKYKVKQRRNLSPQQINTEGCNLFIVFISSNPLFG